MRAPAFAALFLVLSGCASESAGPPGESVELLDVHGIALDPSDASILYVATLRGLLRLDDDARWSYVGSARDDYMGFTAHPSDARVFWASGHPSTGGNLGVIQSTDGGATWSSIGADGVDFHAMAVSPADPARLYGSWRGQTQRSDDGGRSWTGVSALGASGFAPHPTARDVVYAATGRALAHSDDAGASWHPLGGIAALGVAVDPGAPDVLYAGTAGGASKSEDGGRTWSALPFPHAASVAYFATHAATPGLLYAATYQVGIYKSEDHGATWSIVREPSR